MIAGPLMGLCSIEGQQVFLTNSGWMTSRNLKSFGARKVTHFIIPCPVGSTHYETCINLDSPIPNTSNIIHNTSQR